MNASPLQLGLFMPNCSNMSAISTYRTVPDEWPFESNRSIALAAEEAARYDIEAGGQPTTVNGDATLLRRAIRGRAIEG